MKAPVWLAAGLSIASAAGSSPTQVPGPVIAQVDSSYELVLPRAMTVAIQRAVPGFQMESMASYEPDIRRYYRCTSRQVPWAVVGDFDADGEQDLIVDGHDAHRCFRLCVWGATTVVDTVSTMARDRRASASSSVVMYAQPGEHGTNFSDDQIHIHADGYFDYSWEKAGSLWYWKDGKWNEWYWAD